MRDCCCQRATAARCSSGIPAPCRARCRIRPGPRPSRSARGWSPTRPAAGLRGTAQNLSYEGNYGYDACRMLRVFDVVTGRLRSFAAPPGTSGWVPSHGGYWSVSAIARSGPVLAAEAVVPPDRRGLARVFVLHLTGRPAPAGGRPVTRCLPAVRDGMVGPRLVAVLPGSRPAHVGVSGTDGEGAVVQDAVLSVRRDGHR